MEDDSIHVVFFVYLASCWGSCQSICEAMCKDPSFKVTVFLAPYFIEPTTLDYDKDLASLSIPSNAEVVFGLTSNKTWTSLRSLHADVIFMQTPFFDNYFPPEAQASYNVEDWSYENIAQFSRLAYAPYGFYLANITQLQFNTPFHHATWRIFCESPLYVRMYEMYGNITKKVIPCGAPKFDAYNMPYTAAMCNAFWKKEKTPHSKRIIWAPHWSVAEHLNLSHFVEYLPFFQDFLKQHPHVEVLLKPHPLLFRTLLQSGIFSERGLQDCINTWCSLPNASLYEGGNYIPLFLSSDALIGDSISYLAEYLPTLKPLCFLEKSHVNTFNEIGKKLIEAHYVAHSQEDTITFLNAVMTNTYDEKLPQRLKILHELFVFPEQGAGFAIKEYCKRTIHKERIRLSLVSRKNRATFEKE